jgi:hypothetical protein
VSKKGCGFKPYFEHSSLKIFLKFEDLMVHMMSANDLPIMSI